METLAFIPARLGSKRIPQKNIRQFAGKPLLAHTIKQALASPHINRVVVCTESEQIATIARRYGADVPFLRPNWMAEDTADISHSIFYTLDRLKKDEAYEPTHFVILEPTSPLRELEDIADCFKLMKETGATTVVTVTPTHPRLYHLGKNNEVILANGPLGKTTRTQAWRKAFIFNSSIYVSYVPAMRKEGRFLTKKIRAHVMPKLRSVDLDEIEDWVLAEMIFTNKTPLKKRVKTIQGAKKARPTKKMK